MRERGGLTKTGLLAGASPELNAAFSESRQRVIFLFLVLGVWRSVVGGISTSFSGLYVWSRAQSTVNKGVAIFSFMNFLI